MKQSSQIARSTLDRSAGVPPAVAGVSRNAPLWATLVGTFFGIGRLRPGPVARSRRLSRHRPRARAELSFAG